MLCEIKNVGNQLAERQIIDLFLVDPMNPIKSAKDFSSVQCTDFEQANVRREQFREKRMKVKLEDIEANIQKSLISKENQQNKQSISQESEEQKSQPVSRRYERRCGGCACCFQASD